VLLAIAAVLNAGAGIALGIAVTPDDEPAPPPPPRAPQIVAAGDMRLALPDGWRPLETPPQVPGVTNEDAAAARGPRADVVFAILPAASPTLLPQALLDASGDQLPAPGRAEIGGRQALHYAGLGGERADVFAVPSSAGVATLICVSRDTTSVANRCNRLFSRVDVGGGAPIAADESAAFAIRLPAAVAGLNRARADGRRALARQRSARGRARVSRRLAGTYARTAGRLAPLAGESAPATRIVGLITRLGADHRKLAAASARRAPRAARRANARIRIAERRLAAALGEWTGPSTAK
jgi:hypothetical protein